jgi:hypothetical protein
VEEKMLVEMEAKIIEKHAYLLCRFGMLSAHERSSQH